MLQASLFTGSKKKTAWVGPRPGLDVVEKKGILASDRNRIRSFNRRIVTIVFFFFVFLFFFGATVHIGPGPSHSRGF